MELKNELIKANKTIESQKLKIKELENDKGDIIELEEPSEISEETRPKKKTKK